MSSLEENLNKIIGISPLQRVIHPVLDKHNLTLDIKRDDLLHPHISGNKWRKLKYNLIEARNNNIDHIVSFGGSYSNHIYALASAGFYLGFKTTGIIRGEVEYANNCTLSQAKKWGMNLVFVSRSEYRKKHDFDYISDLKVKFPNSLIIPEGGSNQFCLDGVIETVSEIKRQSNKPINHIITATGSGGTLAGLISGVKKESLNTKVTGIAVLKKADYLREEIKSLLKYKGLENLANWSLETEFHQGGYAKVPVYLSDFCIEFTNQTKIPIEPIYTGKILYGLFQLIENGYFNNNDHIVAIHTGGLQGINGLKERKII